MKRTVKRKQKVSRNCFICGEQNSSGLHMSFYETSNDEVVGFFTGKSGHISYPDRMHGGVVCAILDETIGRAIELKYPDMLGFTLEITVRYRRPVPVGIELKCIGRITGDSSRGFKGNGEILGLDGQVLAQAEASYMKIEAPILNEDKMYYSVNIEDKEFIDY